jgi:hypothetical protein
MNLIKFKKIVTCKLQDEDFLRIDKNSSKRFSIIQEKSNEIAKFNFIHALVWKLLLAPFWIIHVSKRPKIIIRGVNKKITHFRKNLASDVFCLRHRVPFVFYSLARVIVLDNMRIKKQGKSYRTLRNEINTANKLGFTCQLFQNTEAMTVLDTAHSRWRKRNWRSENNFDGDLEDIGLVACLGLNQRKEEVALGAMWVSGPYAYLFYYYATEKQNIRWLVTEQMIEFAFNCGVSVLLTDNLMDVSQGSYIFQKALGYETVRLRFN